MPLLSQAELTDRLRDIVSRLRAALSPIAIYFFGSYADGTPRPHSDLDLLVIVKNSEVSPYQRDAIAVRSLRGLPMSIDVQVYTRAEFEERAALPVSFERTVKNKGRLVYAA